MKTTNHPAADAFLEEYVALCKKHDMVLRYDTGDVANKVDNLRFTDLDDVTWLGYMLLKENPKIEPAVVPLNRRMRRALKIKEGK